MYRSGRVLVETRYCYTISVSDTAILKYEGQGEYSGSKLMWDDGSCEVRKVIVLDVDGQPSDRSILEIFASGNIGPPTPQPKPSAKKKSRWKTIVNGTLGGAPPQ